MVGSSEISAGFAGSVLGGLASGNTTTVQTSSSSSSIPSLPTRDESEVKEQSAIKRMLNFSSLATSIDRGFQSNNDILNKLHVSVNLRLDGIQKLLRKQTQILELAYKHQQSWADEERKLALNNKSLPAVAFNNIKKEMDRFIKAFTETVKPEEFRKSMMRALAGTSFGKNMLSVSNYNKHLADAPSTMTKKLKDILENIPNYFDKFSESVNKNLSTINARQREDNNRQLNCCLTSVSLLEKIVAQIETFRLAYAKVNGIHNRQGKSFDDRNFSRSLTRTKGESSTLSASLEKLNRTTKEFKHIQIQFNDNYLEKQESMNKALTNITLYILKPKYFVQYLLPLLFSVNMYRKYMAPMISTAMNSVTPFMQETFKQQNFARFVPIKDSLVNLIEKILPERAFKAFSATGTRIVTLVKTAFNAVFGTDLEKTNARQSIADAVGKTTSKLFHDYVMPMLFKSLAAFMVAQRAWSSMKSFGNDMPGHYKKSMQDVEMSNMFGSLLGGNNKAKKNYAAQLMKKRKAMESAEGFNPLDFEYQKLKMQQYGSNGAATFLSNKIVAPIKRGYRKLGVSKNFEKVVGGALASVAETLDEIKEYASHGSLSTDFFNRQSMLRRGRVRRSAKSASGLLKAPIKIFGGGLNAVGKGLAMTRMPGLASVGGFLSGAGSSMMGSVGAVGGGLAKTTLPMLFGVASSIFNVAMWTPIIYEGIKLFFNSFTKMFASEDKYKAFAGGQKGFSDTAAIVGDAMWNFVTKAIPKAIGSVFTAIKFSAAVVYGMAQSIYKVIYTGLANMLRFIFSPTMWKSGAIKFGNWVVSSFSGTPNGVAPQEEKMPDTVQETVEKTLTPMEQRLSTAAEGFRSTMDNLREFFSKDFKPMMEKTFSSMGKSIKDLFAFGVEMFTKLKDGMSPLLGTIAGSMGAFMHGFFGADSANQILDRAIANSEKAGNTRVAAFLKTSKSSVMDLMKAASETQMTAANIQMESAKIINSSLKSNMESQGLGDSSDAYARHFGNSVHTLEKQMPKSFTSTKVQDIKGYERSSAGRGEYNYTLKNAQQAAIGAMQYKEANGSLPEFLGNITLPDLAIGGAGTRKQSKIASGSDSSVFRSIIPLNVEFTDKDNFGEPRQGKRGPYSHAGNDLSLATGTPITVPLPGTVIKKAFDSDGYGNYVVVQHPGGYQTLYAHLSEVYVEKDRPVNIGDIIGKTGNTGRSTGPHLHFEAIKDGKKLNPAKFLKATNDTINKTGKQLTFESKNATMGSAYNSSVINYDTGTGGTKGTGGGDGGPLPNLGVSGYRTVINGQVRSGTLAQRNFNPGNIRYYPSSSVNKLAIGHSNKFLVFPDEMTGFKAMDYLITGTKRYGNGSKNLSDVIRTWAPPSENDTNGYIRFVLNKTGLGNRRMMDYSEDERIMIYKAMALKEGYYNGKGAASKPSFGIQMVNNGNAQTLSDLNSRAKAMDYNNSAQIASTNWSGGGDMGVYKPETRPIIVDGRNIIYANQGGSTTVANSNSTNAGGGGGDFNSSWNNVLGI